MDPRTYRVLFSVDPEVVQSLRRAPDGRAPDWDPERRPASPPAWDVGVLVYVAGDPVPYLGHVIDDWELYFVDEADPWDPAPFEDAVEIDVDPDLDANETNETDGGGDMDDDDDDDECRGLPARSQPLWDPGRAGAVSCARGRSWARRTRSTRTPTRPSARKTETAGSDRSPAARPFRGCPRRSSSRRRSEAPSSATPKQLAGVAPDRSTLRRSALTACPKVQQSLKIRSAEASELRGTSFLVIAKPRSFAQPRERGRSEPRSFAQPRERGRSEPRELRPTS